MNNWISVKDYLPAMVIEYKNIGFWQSNCVLVVDNGRITIAYCGHWKDEEIEWIESDSDGNTLYNVTHWQPLPELPKEK